ncbi:tyrosine-type recombinase/integrase [Nonomuraea sp. ZG12]|uniref:tyrosine-type recombinase/integrase n=1 Tax=Nonomuraea sp. ZG12 TaxID=3452207 RepID=UPI003F8B6FD2
MTRKPNGRSSIYLGKDGKWHGWVTMGVKDDGSADRRHRIGSTEAEATRKVRELEKQRDSGKTDKPGRAPTIAEWMRTYLDEIAPLKVSDRTLESTYRPKAEHWIIPRLGAHRLNRLRPERLDAFYAYLGQQQLAQNTIVQIHRILSRALKIAVRREKIARNVCTLIDAPAVEDVEIEPLDADETRDVLDVAHHQRNGTRWSVALALGLRQCEALGLRWKYVDLKQGVIRVFWQIKHQRHRHGCKDPHACGERLHRYPCPEDCPKARRTSGRKHVVWCHPDGRPIDAGQDWDEWKELLRLAEVDKDARVHDARHTAATLLIEQGVDISVVQEILGHSQLTTTKGYTHITATLSTEAAARMGRALWG